MAKKKRRKKRYKNKKNNTTKYIVILVLLIILILFTTSKIISLEKYANYYQINENTSKYISYQYKDENVIELKTKVLSNNKGIKTNKAYTYTVKNNTENDIEYQILLTPINIENEDDLYIYITDRNNNKLIEVTKYSDLPNIGNNKVIITSKLSRGELSKQKLRIWSSKNPSKISFKISTKIK